MYLEQEGFARYTLTKKSGVWGGGEETGAPPAFLVGTGYVLQPPSLRYWILRYLSS